MNHTYIIIIFPSIYSLCFSIDGTQLFATAGHDLLIYRSIDGYLLHTLKGKYILKFYPTQSNYMFQNISLF